MSAAVEEGLDGPLEYFAFKQPAAEFKLKVDFPLAAWDGSSAPKSSLLRVCQKQKLALFPVGNKGALGCTSIEGLADKEALGSVGIIPFPMDESHILAMVLTPDESALFVAKGSQKVYKLTFSASALVSIVEQTQASKVVVDMACIGSSLAVLFEEGEIKFYTAELQPKETQYPSGPFNCFAAKGPLLLAGYRESLKVEVLDQDTGSVHSISFPESASGIGIGSLFLVSEDTFLCSVVPVDVDTGDFDLFLVAHFNETPSFTRFMDPCAARPPRANQFLFGHIADFAATRADLADFVILGNNASPDIGIAGRSGREEAFQTFFIDNDEGLAQLPLEQGKLTFPLGLALDFTSRKPISDPSDQEFSGPFPPAPVLWILTSAGHLCPFSMVKTNEKPTKWPFMLHEAETKIAGSDADADTNTNTNTNGSTSIEEELSIQSFNGSSKGLLSVPSDVTRTSLSDEDEDEVSELPAASIKSSKDSINEVEKEDGTVVVEKPRAFEAAKPMCRALNSAPALKAVSSPSNFSSSPMSTTSVITSDHPTVLSAHELAMPKPQSKEDIDLGPYKNILLDELALAHEAMRADVDQLAELADKSKQQLQQATCAFFSKLESLETYADVIERLLASSEKAFGGLMQRTRDAREQLDHVSGEVKQIKATWRRIKLDQRINWSEKRLTLQCLTSDIIEKIEELGELFGMSNFASLNATAKTLYREIIRHMQSLMAFLSVLFVLPETEGMDQSSAHESAAAGLRELTLSTDSLLVGMNSLSIGQNFLSDRNPGALRRARQKAILQAAKTRGARLHIPEAKPPVLRSASLPIAALSAPDEELLEKFTKSLSIVEEAPRFETVSAATGTKVKPTSASSSLATTPLLPSALSKEEIAKIQQQSQPKPVAELSKHDPVSTKTEPAPALPRLVVPSSIALPTTFSFSEKGKVDQPSGLKPIEFSKAFPETPKPSRATKPVEIPLRSQSPAEASVLKAFPDPSPSPSFTFARPAETESAKLDFSSLALGTTSSATRNTEPATKAVPSIFTVPKFDESKQPSALNASPSTGSPFNFAFQSKSEPIAAVSSALNAPVPSALNAPVSNPFSAQMGTSAATKPTFSFASSAVAPQFGQTSMPSTMPSSSAFGALEGLNSVTPASGGFAAFAQQHQQQPSLSFASFRTQPSANQQQQQSLQQGQPGSGLPFAAFKPNDPHSDQKKPSSSATFSFSGFRE